MSTVPVGTTTVTGPAEVSVTDVILPYVDKSLGSVPIVVLPVPPLLKVILGAAAPSLPYPPPASVNVIPVTV